MILKIKNFGFSLNLLINMNTTKYGNEHCYCMLESGWLATEPIEIWQDIGLGHKEAIATTNDKYNAMMIVDAINLTRESRKMNYE